MINFLWLVEITCKHVDVCAVRNGEYVRRNFITPLASVQFSTTSGIYRESFVRIDGNAKQSGVGLDKGKKNVFDNFANFLYFFFLCEELNVPGKCQK